MTRVTAAVLAAALAVLCACGKYGPPIRPKPTPAHGAQNPTTPPPPLPEGPDSLPAPEPRETDPQVPDPQAVQPQSSNTEQCDDPNAASAGSRP